MILWPTKDSRPAVWADWAILFKVRQIISYFLWSFWSMSLFQKNTPLVTFWKTVRKCGLLLIPASGHSDATELCCNDDWPEILLMLWFASDVMAVAVDDVVAEVNRWNAELDVPAVTSLLTTAGPLGRPEKSKRLYPCVNYTYYATTGNKWLYHNLTTDIRCKDNLPSSSRSDRARWLANKTLLLSKNKSSLVDKLFNHFGRKSRS